MSGDREEDRRMLPEMAEEVAQSGSWEWDVRTDRLMWSDNLYRIFGLQPGEIIPTPAYVVERTHADDRDRLSRSLDEARADGRIGPTEYRIVRADGAVRHLRALQAVIEQSGGRRQKLVGSVQDISDWRRAEREIAAHVAVSEALDQWETFEQGAVELLRDLAEALDSAAGVLWVPQGDALAPRAFWQSRSLEASGLESDISGLRNRRGGSLPARAWQTKAPRSGPAPEDEGTPAGEVVSFAAIPTLDRDEVLAVIELYCEPARCDMSDRLLDSLTGIGHELGRFLSRRRGELSPAMLTPREVEVLQLAAQGETARGIAEQLVVSAATVSTHLKNIYAKYGVSDRASAVAKALREGLIE